MLSHHSKSHTCAFAESGVFGQGDIGGEVEGKGEDFDVFIAEPFFFEFAGDAHFEAFGDVPADAGGEGDDMGGEEAFEEGVLFGDTGEGFPHVEVFGIEGFPLMDAVRHGGFPHAEAVLVHVQARDAHGVVVFADAHAPVGLREEVVGFFDAVVEAQEHGADFVALGIEFVLDEGVSLVIAAGFVVVIVEPFVFHAYFSGDGPAEPGQFPGVNMGVERHGKDAELVVLHNRRV